jgi:hypothetical protein
MSTTTRLSKLIERASVPVGTYQYKIDSRGWNDTVFEWVMEAAAVATPAADIKIYTSALPVDAPTLNALDPAANPFWVEQVSAIFANYPGDAIGSDSITLSNNPFSTVLVWLNVLQILPKFSLHVRGQDRGR